MNTMSLHPKINSSGESHETSLSDRFAQALRMVDDLYCLVLPESKDEAPESTPSMPSESPSEVVKRTLSAYSVISTSSIFARRLNAERLAQQNLEFRVIGLGSCGSVFEMPGTAIAFKKSSNTDALWNDFRLTNMVHNAFIDAQMFLQQAFPERTIPRTPMCHEFFLKNSASWWAKYLSRFPEQHRRESAVFSVDRILPLSQATRDALIQLYFDDAPAEQERAMRSDENKHCLVRLYLGAREMDDEQSGTYDSLLNFPLKLNMAEDLDLDLPSLTSEMAIGLAVIHWGAKVDGMDCEFVLGSSTTRPRETIQGFTRSCSPREVHEIDFKTRSTHLWVLDFDKSTPINCTKVDVDKKLVPSFLGNDPYFPRPDVDPKLWSVFSDAYITASYAILKSHDAKQSVLNLPQRFLDKTVAMIESTGDWDPEKDIVFCD